MRHINLIQSLIELSPDILEASGNGLMALFLCEIKTSHILRWLFFKISKIMELFRQILWEKKIEFKKFRENTN